MAKKTIQAPDYITQLRKKVPILKKEDVEEILHFILKECENYKRPHHQFTPNSTPRLKVIYDRMSELQRKHDLFQELTKEEREEMESLELEEPILLEKRYAPMFKEISHFIDELSSKNPALILYTQELKMGLFYSLRNFICEYAKSAKLHLSKDQTATITKTPFSLGAQKEIVITKRLNADGTYNTEYSSRTSDFCVIYDSKGNVVSTVGKGNDLEKIARALYKKGYNCNYFENGNVWFSEDYTGSAPADTVKEWVMRTRTDNFAKEDMKELNDYLDYIDSGNYIQ